MNIAQTSSDSNQQPASPGTGPYDDRTVNPSVTQRQGTEPEHRAKLAQLPTTAARIRYVCDYLQQAAPDRAVDTAEVRVHLERFEVDPMPARETVSREVGKWKRAQTEGTDPATPLTDPAGDQVDPPMPTPSPTDSFTSQEPPPAIQSRKDTASATFPEPVPLPGAQPSDHDRPAHDTAGSATPQDPSDHTLTSSSTPPADTRPTPVISRSGRIDQDPDTLTDQPPDRANDPGRRHTALIIRRIGYAVLAIVAAAGGVLSYTSLRVKAAEIFGYPLAYGFPVAVDMLIVGASLAYLGGAMIGRGRPGWRLTAHAGVAATLVLNALAASTWAGVPWHIAGAAVWSVLVELVARDLLGDHVAESGQTFSTIPLALWLTAPRESAATWLRLRRQAAHAATRARVGEHDAALELLRMAIPGRHGRRTRKVIARQLRAGSVTPQAVASRASAILAAAPANSPEGVRRDVLTSAVATTV